jgi:CheY-like chemotaxis protein
MPECPPLVSPFPIAPPSSDFWRLWTNDENLPDGSDAELPLDGSPNRGRRSILVVEDDADSRETFCALLDDAGYDCVAVENGREALDFLRSHDRPFAILLDLMMPTMDGWQFRREQASDPALEDIPLVVVSAAKLARNSALQFGAELFLLKPIQPNQLIQAFDNLRR